jgi:hypothetical protein
MILFREAGPGDLEGILRLYRQLQPDDPVLRDGSDAAAFAQILGSPGLHLFVLEATHAFYRACGFSPDAKTAYLARPLTGR